MKLNAHLFDDDPELRSLLIALLKKRRGFSIDLFAMLSVCELEDGRFSVMIEKEGEFLKYKEYLFEDPKKAVDCFLGLRRERELGYDFERITKWPAALQEPELDVRPDTD